MAATERALTFHCRGQQLVGIVHEVAGCETVFVFVVGGPQTRVGSHRMFVEMARRFGAAGISALRFDVRGMGDSDGEFASFENLDEDVASAVDLASTEFPSAKVFLIGLCDGASAIAMYAANDPRVAGIALLNPWVRSAQLEAQTLVRHYYLKRIFQRTLWTDLISGRLNVVRSVREFLRDLLAARARGDEPAPGFIDRMLRGVREFRGPALVILSDNDLTAQEFAQLAEQDRDWKLVLAAANVDVATLDADHTFSGESELDAMMARVLQWHAQAAIAGAAPAESSTG